MLLVTLRDENSYDEKLKERANNESDCSLPWQAAFDAP
jgi:hypothetical protein